jgi:hypothetical protein
MEKLKALARRKEFHVLLFCVFLFLFSWPVAAFESPEGLKGAFVYLFSVWTVVIVIQYLVSRSLEEETTDGDEDRRGDDPC